MEVSFRNMVNYYQVLPELYFVVLVVVIKNAVLVNTDKVGGAFKVIVSVTTSW